MEATAASIMSVS